MITYRVCHKQKCTVCDFSSAISHKPPKYMSRRTKYPTKWHVRSAKTQPGHPPSLIIVFAFGMKIPWVLSYPWSAQRRLWSDWTDAQADPSLRMGAQISLFLSSSVSYIDVIYKILKGLISNININKTLQGLLTPHTHTHTRTHARTQLRVCLVRPSDLYFCCKACACSS